MAKQAPKPAPAPKSSAKYTIQLKPKYTIQLKKPSKAIRVPGGYA